MPKNKRLADKAANRLEMELNRQASGDLTYDEFEQRYVSEHLSGLSKGSQSKWSTASNYLREMIQPGFVADIDSPDLSRFAAELRKRKIAETTVAGYLRQIMAGLRWAASVNIIAEPPVYQPSRRSRGVSQTMRSRPVTETEYLRMREAATDVIPEHAADIQRLLDALFWSGLRLEEAISLSWDVRAGFAVDMSGDFPMYRIDAASEKGHKDRLLPIAPEFARILQETTEAQRRGRVLRLPGRKRRVQSIIASLAEMADVKVNAQGKLASAQDFRRAFGTRWARRLRPAELKELMRHESLATTEKFYIEIEAGDLAQTLWDAAGDKTGDRSRPIRPPYQGDGCS